ncbi:MAG: hypothetical protein ACREFI_19505, partial [Stellaceae bacterium]
ALQRPDTWKIPAPITELCALKEIAEPPPIAEPLPPKVLEQIRALGSELRTRMAADLDSRRELSDRGAHQPEDTRTRSG